MRIRNSIFYYTVSTVISGLAALSICGCSSAQASDTASTEFEITGTAPPVCRFSQHTTPNAQNASLDGTMIEINQLLDEINATVKQSKLELTFPNVMCNYNAYLVVSSANGGMQRDQGSDIAVADSGSFLDHVDYKVAAVWGSVAIEDLDTSTGQKSAWKEAGGANSADLIVTVTTDQGTVPVYQGHYSDTLTIKVGSTY
jgi:hypothetical protein